MTSNGAKVLPHLIHRNPAFTCAGYGADITLLLSETSAAARGGSLFQVVMDKLQLPVLTSELTALLAEQFGEAEVHAALIDLLDLGAIREPIPADSFEEAVFRSAVPFPVAGAAVELFYFAERGESVVMRALDAFGISCQSGAKRAIAVAGDYLDPELSRVCEMHSECLIAKITGHTLWLGPLIRAGESACWECLAGCIRPHRWQELCFAESLESIPLRPALGCHPASLSIGAGLIATATSKWLATGVNEDLKDRILTIDLRCLRPERHTVRRRPGCAKCGPTKFKWRRSSELNELVSPITGVVSALVKTEIPVCGLHHVHSAFVHALPVGHARLPLRPQSAIGKATNRTEAEIAAIAEAVERHSIAYRGDEQRVSAKSSDLDSILPDQLLLFSERQYTERDAWNAANHEFQWVPERFDLACATDWVTVESLHNAKKRFIPAGYCYMWYPFHGQPRFCAADTNGCAAGETREQALLHATLELVERDAVAIWWYNRLERPAVELRSFADAGILALQDALAKVGREIHLLDLTTDLGIPAYAAIAPKRDGSEPCFGCASHVSPRTAALKAIGEAIQVGYWVRGQRYEDELTRFLRTANLKNSRYLKAVSEVRAAPERALRTEEAIQFCLDRLRAAGLDLYWHDMTREEIGLPVVRAVAPGLRHFWARHGTGRLYDVPVRMGWTPFALTESQLNPTPCMI